MSRSVIVNGRTYPWPLRSAIAICLDGCEPAYLDAAAIAAGLMPTFKRLRASGTDRISHSVIPSFTNPTTSRLRQGVRQQCMGFAATTC